MLSNNPRLSVLLPAYNAEKYLSQAIESILNQSMNDFELIIADDASRDNTATIIESFAQKDKRIVLTKNERNEGKNRTANRLFELSKGEYVTIHDADDYSDKMRFRRQIEFLDENQDYAMCGCSFYSIDKSDNLLSSTELETDYTVIRKKIELQSQFHGPTIVFRRDVIRKVGGLYRWPFIVAEDIDLCERIVERFHCKNIPELLYYYRIHNKSLSKKNELYTPMRYALKDLMVYLRNERKQSDTDSLWNNVATEEIRNIYNGFVSKWELRRDLVYEDGISRNLSLGFKASAVLLSLKWVHALPLNFSSWKALIRTIYMVISR